MHVRQGCAPACARVDGVFLRLLGAVFFFWTVLSHTNTRQALVLFFFFPASTLTPSPMTHLRKCVIILLLCAQQQNDTEKDTGKSRLSALMKCSSCLGPGKQP